MGTEWSISEGASTEEWDITLEVDDPNEWSIKPLAMNPNADANNSILNASNWAAEEFNVLPEFANIMPEATQADKDEWTIVDSEAR